MIKFPKSRNVSNVVVFFFFLIPPTLHPHQGLEIVTGNAKNGTYFRIHINKYKMVETITCLSKEPFPASNYIRLFGQHEQLLNNLCARYEDKLIPDLYR